MRIPSFDVRFPDVLAYKSIEQLYIDGKNHVVNLLLWKLHQLWWVQNNHKIIRIIWIFAQTLMWVLNYIWKKKIQIWTKGKRYNSGHKFSTLETLEMIFFIKNLLAAGKNYFSHKINHKLPSIKCEKIKMTII